jgi:hypothetical protein
LTTPATRFGLLLFLALLTALGAAFFLFQQERRLASSVWPEYALDDVRSIEVATLKERYTLLHEASGWVGRLEGGEDDAPPVPADVSRIDALLSSVAHNRPRQMVDPGSEGAGQALADSTVQITIKPVRADDREARLTLGIETPTGAAIYAHSSLALRPCSSLTQVFFTISTSLRTTFSTRGCSMCAARTSNASRLSALAACNGTWSARMTCSFSLFRTPCGAAP